ncbi:MAG: MCE family protein [Bauldia sp.]|nr:MCE family protein [Bauldia sp.]
METKANHVLVGAFTLVAILLGVGLIYWISIAGGGGGGREIRVIITGSAVGLESGSRVLFNGLPVGNVSRVGVYPDDPTKVEAMIRVAPDTPIRTDTNAALVADIIGGTAYIELGGGTPGAPFLLAEEGVPTIEAGTAGLNNIIEGADTIVAGVDDAVTRVNTILDRTGPDLERAVANVTVFTDALAENAEGVEAFLAAVADMADTLTGLGARLETTVAGFETVLGAVQAEQVQAIMADAGTAVANIANATAGIQTVVDNVEQAAVGLNTLTEGLDTALATVNDVVVQAGAIVAAVDPVAVAGVVADIQTITGRANTATANLDAILAGAETAIGQVADLTTGLNETRDRFDTVLAAIDPARIETIVANVDAFGAQLAGAGDAVTGLLTRADGVIGTAETLFAAVDPAQITAAVDGVAGFVTRLDGATVNLDVMMAEAQAAIGEIGTFAEGLNATRENVDTLIAAVDPARIEAVLANVDAFGANLAGAGDRIDGVVDRVDTVIGQAETLIAAIDLAVVAAALDGITGTVNQARALVAAVDPELVRAAVDNVTTVVRRIDEATTGIGTMVGDAQVAIANITRLSDNLNTTLANVDALIAGVDPAQIAIIVENVTTLTAGLQDTGAQIDAVLADAGEAVAAVNDFIATFTARGGDIDAIITNARTATDDATAFIANLNGQADGIAAFVAQAQEIGARLNASTVRLDEILADVGTLFDAENTEGFIQEATAAVQSIRIVADTFQTQAGGILGGIEAFSTRGLANLSALIANAGTTMDRIDNFARQLETAPAQLLFGGGGANIPDYNRR